LRQIQYSCERLVGNFPQAISHIGLINAALSLEAGTSVRLRELFGNHEAFSGKSHESRKKGRSLRTVAGDFSLIVNILQSPGSFPVFRRTLHTREA
jgi:hypothetical protein